MRIVIQERGYPVAIETPGGGQKSIRLGVGDRRGSFVFAIL